MAWAPIVLTVVSTAISAYSQMQQGKAQAAMADYNAKVADANTKVNEAAALDASQRGADEAAQVKERARRIAASQRAGAAAGGVAADSGSALDLLTETSGMGELDALTTMNNAQREAYGYRVQGMNSTAQANLQRTQSKLYKSAGAGNAMGTLLTGGAKAYGQGQSAGYWGN